MQEKALFNRGGKGELKDKLKKSHGFPSYRSLAGYER